MSAIFSTQTLQRLRAHCSSLPLAVLLLSLAIGFATTFVASHLLIQHSDKKALSSYLASVTDTTKQLHGTIAQVFRTSSVNIMQMCTKPDLKRMRSFLWNNSQLKEIARVQNGNLICSASWGMLSPPVKLPTPTQSWERHNYYHWRNIRDVIQGTVNVNMIANSNMLVVISPYAYASILPANKYVGFIISTTDKSNYVSHSTGPLNADSVLNDHSYSITMLKQQSCGYLPDSICVTVYNYQSGLFGKDQTFLAFVALIALVISLLIYTSLLSFMNYRNSMRKALKRALEKKELFVVFQPKVNLHSGEIVGMEALARWHDGQFGNVPPDVFITVAEESGFMPKLSRLVIEKSLDYAGSLLNKNPHLQLSINLSMADLSDPMLLDFIDYHRSNHSIQTQQLVFEITETSAAGFDQIENSVDQFVSRGYGISLDDFGTGYANLSWLSKIKASEIKVDRSFTQMIGSQDNNHNKTLNAIFKLVKDLNMAAVFEGIETQEQAEYIQSHTQNAIGQGWLYAKPMPIEQLQQFIGKHTHAFSNVHPGHRSHRLICEPIIP